MRLGWLFVLAAAAVGTQCDYPEYRFEPEETAGAGGGGGAGGEPVTAGTAGVEDGGAAGAGAAAGAGGQSGAPGDGGGGGEGGEPPALCLKGPTVGCECRTLGNGRVYEFCDILHPRATAQLWCEADGGTLARLESVSENGLVTLAMIEALPTAGVVAWLQATDLDLDGEWIWNDGTVLFAGGVTVPGQYTNWGGGEPNGTGSCTILRSDGGWDDIACEVVFSFICEQIEP